MPKLKKLRRTLDALRRRLGSVRNDEVAALAQALGRTRFNRGKEPTYVKPGRPPLTIPAHGTLKVGTAASIVNQLEEDLLLLEEAEQLEEGTEDDEGAGEA